MFFLLTIAVLIGGVAVLARVANESWLAPAALFASLWFLYLIFSLFYILNSDIDPNIDILGFLWILLACITVYLGSLVGRRRARMRPSSARVIKPLRLAEFPHLRRIVILLTAIGFIDLIFPFYNSGLSMNALLSPFSIALVSATNRSNYIYGDLVQGSLERILLIFVYLGPLMGGVYFKLSPQRKEKLLGLLPLFLISFISILYGSRMGPLFGGSFWLSSYMSVQIIATPKTSKPLNLRFLTRLAFLAAFILLGLSAITQFVRYTPVMDAFNYFTIFADPFGFVAAFCQWTSSYAAKPTDLTYGYRTFWHLYKLFGIVFQETEVTDVGFTTSNIYTVFRGLIEDFGWMGALGWLFGFGYLGHLSYQKVLYGRRRFVPLLITTFSFIFVSMSFSLFTYNAPTVALLLCSLYFLYSFSPRRLRSAESKSFLLRKPRLRT